MRTKNAMQLKARINARAREAGIPAQSLMWIYLFERLLERLSKSKWRDNIIIKGDSITPGPVAYDYPLLFDEGSVGLMSYPLETVLAEKLETVVSRGVANTRPRDFYDIHLLWKTRGGECEIPTLREALEHTCVKRGSVRMVARW